MEVVKEKIARKDVAKVMREVGYNKTSVEGKGGSNIESQLAEANENAKSLPTMADAINKAMDRVTPGVAPPVILPKKDVSAKVAKEKVVKKEPVKEPTKAPVEEDDIQEPKLIVIDMTNLRTEVTFTGEGWKILDIKLAYAAMVRGFRIKIRDEYRKGIK